MPQGINGDPLGHQEQRSRLDLHFRNLAHRRKTSEPIGSKGLCSIALREYTLERLPLSFIDLAAPPVK